MFDGLFDKWIILYIVVAGGLTELLMRTTPKSVSRRRFGGLVVVVLAVGVALLDGSIRGLSWRLSVFRGLVAAAFTQSVYDHLKTLLPKKLFS